MYPCKHAYIHTYIIHIPGPPKYPADGPCPKQMGMGTMSLGTLEVEVSRHNYEEHFERSVWGVYQSCILNLGPDDRQVQSLQYLKGSKKQNTGYLGLLCGSGNCNYHLR